MLVKGATDVDVLDPVSESHKTPYLKIPWSLGGTGLITEIIASLCAWYNDNHNDNNVYWKLQWKLPSQEMNSLLYTSCNTVRSRYSLKISRKTPHSSPVRFRYGVSFLNIKSDRIWIIVTLVLGVPSWYRWPRYIEILKYMSLVCCIRCRVMIHRVVKKFYCVNWSMPLFVKHVTGLSLGHQSFQRYIPIS